MRSKKMKKKKKKKKMRDLEKIQTRKKKRPKGKRPKGKRPRQRRPNKRPFIRWDRSKDDPHGFSNAMICDRMIHNDRRVEDRFIDDESM